MKTQGRRPAVFLCIGSAFAALLLIGPVALVARASAGSTIDLNVTTSGVGQFSTFSWAGPFPLTVIFTPEVTGVVSPTYSWQFGDGTNSTDSNPVHVYNAPCIYTISLSISESGVQGHTASGTVTLVPYADLSPSGAMLVCPAAATVGLSKVQMAGGFFASTLPVGIYSNGTSLANFTSDGDGNWKAGVTSLLPPKVNGTVYVLKTIPTSVTEDFITIEGIKAFQTSGMVGDNVTIEGRSYAADIPVTVYLNGAELGVAQSDAVGSFLQTFQIPNSPSLSQSGTYVFTTSPPILGAGLGSKYTIVATVGPTSPGSMGFWLWFLIALLLILLLALLLYLLLRRRLRAIVGTDGASETVHFQDPKHVSNSYCGRTLKETWKATISKRAKLSDLGKNACGPCFDAWKKDSEP